MITGKTYLKTLADIDQFAAFKNLLKEDIQLGKLYLNPARVDETPGCSFFVNDSGVLLFNDFAKGRVYDAAALMSAVTTKPYKYCFDKLINTPVVETEVKKVQVRAAEFDHVERAFTASDINYWASYGVRSLYTIQKFGVKPIKTLYLNETVHWRNTEENPIFALQVGNKFRYYRPKAKDKHKKWRGNLKKQAIFGYSQLPDSGSMLIITKSLKDVMCLYELGYSAIAPVNEGVRIDKSLIDELKDRFVNLVIFYDNDEEGVKFAKKMADRLKLPNIQLPVHKDISDNFFNEGYEATTNTLNQLLNDIPGFINAVERTASTQNKRRAEEDSDYFEDVPF